MFKLLLLIPLALLWSCGTSNHQRPPKGMPFATIYNQMDGSFGDGKYHRVVEIDGKEVRSLNHSWPIQLSPGKHEVILQATHVGFRVPGSPKSGKVAATLTLQSGTEYNLIGKIVSNESEMWLEEKNTGKRVTPVFRTHLNYIPPSAPTIIYL